jgi:hypothetical protein
MNLAPDVARIARKGETMTINVSIFHRQPISGTMNADKLVLTTEKVNKTTRINTRISELAYRDDTGCNLHILLVSVFTNSRYKFIFDYSKQSAQRCRTAYSHIISRVIKC